MYASLSSKICFYQSKNLCVMDFCCLVPMLMVYIFAALLTSRHWVDCTANWLRGYSQAKSAEFFATIYTNVDLVMLVSHGYRSGQQAPLGMLRKTDDCLCGVMQICHRHMGDFRGAKPQNTQVEGKRGQDEDRQNLLRQRFEGHA
jgi:hypothetical protein